MNLSAIKRGLRAADADPAEEPPPVEGDPPGDPDTLPDPGEDQVRRQRKIEAALAEMRATSGWWISPSLKGTDHD
ncbi:MAG TPA: hypothetical protein VGK16_02045 [Candidatus Limnocylindrales bacterium]|jgi:hypothetical protein